MTEFTKTKFDSLDGRVIVSWSNGTFSVSGSRSGVEFKGEFLIEDAVGLNAFAKLVSDAWTEHRRLVPKIVSTLSGH